MSENSSDIGGAEYVKSPRPLLKRPFALAFALLVIPLVAITLFAEVYKYTTAFSYSATGDQTPTNTSSLQVFAVRPGITKLDDVERPSKGCSDSFTSLTCNLFVASAVLTLLGGLFAISTAALFVWLAKAQKPKESRVWGSYLSTALLSFLALAISLGMAVTASHRVRDAELNAGISKAVSDGILPVVQSTVAAGIQNSTTQLQQQTTSNLPRCHVHFVPRATRIGNIEGVRAKE